MEENKKRKLFKKIIENTLYLSGVLSTYHFTEKQLLSFLNKRKTFQKLSQESKNQIISYTLSLINASIVTYQSLKQILKKRKEKKENFEHNRNLNVSMIGYFIYDFYSSFNIIKEKKTDIIHHLFGILLLIFALNQEILNWLPYFVIAEGSTIMLDISMILKEFGVDQNNKIYKFASYSFAILFFILRVVNLPILSIQLILKKPEFIKKLPKIIYGKI
eukprot:gene9712-1917_t